MIKGCVMDGGWMVIGNRKKEQEQALKGAKLLRKENDFIV